MIKCRTCGSENCEYYLTAKDLNQNKSNDKFKYYRCGNCESIFISPIPKNLSIYYGSDYPAYAVNKSHDQELLINNLEEAKLNLVKQYATNGKLIEVGPASGRFLKIASENGYKVLGIEQDSECVNHIKNVLHINTILSNNPASELSKETSTCDIIVAWHVIEHLSNPQEFIVAVSKALLKPNGLVFISAPNPSALSFKVFGRHWVHLDAPRHLTLIPLKALDNIMKSCGLERVNCIFDDAVGLRLNKIGWISSSINLYKNKIAHWLFFAWAGRILHLVMRPVERAHGNGAAYTVIYKNTGVISEK